MFKKFLFKLSNFIIQRNFKFSQDIPLSYLIYIIYKRVTMLIRGFFIGFFFRKRDKNLFVGKNVTILSKSKLSVGKNTSINDYVFIDAMSYEGISLGNNVSIGMRTIIRISGSLERVGKGLKIGNDTALGNDCFIGAAGGVVIGNNVAIGQNVRFHSENHNFKLKNLLISEQGVTNKGIIIEDDCWIGSGVVFLDGVIVGKGTVIGANSLVTKNLESYSIAVGSPAKVIDKRQ